MEFFGQTEEQRDRQDTGRDKKVLTLEQRKEEERCSIEELTEEGMKRKEK